MNADLLKLICCPATRQSLIVAEDALVARINAGIRDGSVKDAEGKLVEDELDSALETSDGRLAYPVRQGIPVLLVSAGIPVGGLGNE